MLTTKRPPEFYEVRVSDDGKIHWRGMTLVHIKDLDEDRRKEVIEEIRKLKGQGFGRDRIQKRIAEARGVYVPEGILKKLIRGDLDIDWSRSRIRGPYKDYRKRVAMCRRVQELRALGYDYRRITKEIEREFGERLPLTTVRYWCKGVRLPERRVKKIEATPDVYWLVGLIIADGSVYRGVRRNHKTHVVNVYTTDEEIVEKVKAMNLGYINICFNSRRFMITLGKRLLVDLVEEIRELIGQARYDELITKMGDGGTRMFIRGFFDGDGSGLFVHFINSDLSLLRFIRYALRRYGIETSRPMVAVRKGTVKYFTSEGRWSGVRKDVFRLFIYPDHYDRFFELIGTTIPRKVQLKAISQDTLQHHSRRYGYRCRLIDEVRKRYENNEDWADVLMWLLRVVGIRLMRKKRKTIPSPFYPSNSR